MTQTVSHVLKSLLSSQLLDKKKTVSIPKKRGKSNQIYDERPSRIRMVRLRAFIKHHPAMLILHCWSNGWTEIAGPLLHSVSTTSSDFPNPFLESHENKLSRLFTRTPNLDLEAAFLQPRAPKLLRCSIFESTPFSRIWVGMNADHQLIFIRRTPRASLFFYRLNG